MHEKCIIFTSDINWGTCKYNLMRQEVCCHVCNRGYSNNSRFIYMDEY